MKDPFKYSSVQLSNRADERFTYTLSVIRNVCILKIKQKRNRNVLVTHPRLVVKDSQQVHGVIQILLSQRASEWWKSGKMKRHLISNLSNQEEGALTCQPLW